MLRNIAYLFICIILPTLTVYGQQDFKRNTIEFSLGQGGSGDELLLKNQFAPTVAINYTRKLTKRIGINTELLTYTRYLSVGFDTEDLSGSPILDLFLNSNSPFQTTNVEQSISNAGINVFGGIGKNHKFNSTILSLNFNYQIPLTKHFITQFSIGPNLSYNTYKWFSNQSSAQLTTTNGESFPIFYTENKEVRSLTIGNRTKLSFIYAFDEFNLGLKVGNVNFFFLEVFNQDLTFWDTSIVISKNF